MLCYNTISRKWGRGYFMNIAICDDCFEDAMYLKSFLSGHDVRIFLDGEELLDSITKFRTKYDLYLLDIYMDSLLNGIETAKKIRLNDEEAGICFVSSSEDFYREAYDLYDVNYLLKPVRKESIDGLMERIKRRLIRDKQQTFNFRWNGQMGSIPYGNILYISSDAHTIHIHCKDGAVQECKGKLNEIEMQMQGRIFMRCHQSFLVNMYHIDNLSGNELMIAGNRIPISRRYFAEIKNRYQEVLFEEVN